MFKEVGLVLLDLIGVHWINALNRLTVWTLDTYTYYSPILATLTQAHGSDRLLSLWRLQLCHVQNEDNGQNTLHNYAESGINVYEAFEQLLTQR